MSAVTAQKRSFPRKIIDMRKRKRQRLEPAQDVQTRLGDPHRLTRAAKQSLRADELRWSASEMPDQLDDYEGFFGLEEIDDVDVIRDTTTGIVSYSAIATANSTLGESPEGVETKRPFEAAEGVDSLGYEDEWDGMGDDESDLLAASDKTSNQPVRIKPAIQNEQSAKVTAPELARDSAFEVLQTHEEKEADVSAWTSLGLSSETLSGLSSLGFSQPTTIQQASIPPIMAGNDLIGKAPTGSGKTLAFGIPILEDFLSLRSAHENPSLRALIVLPTRELSYQIRDHLTSLWFSLSTPVPRIATLTGGLSIQKQRRLLDDANIVVATPGRLWEVMSASQDVLPRLRAVRFLVVDEADRLLSEGHFKELTEILTSLDRKTDDDEDPHSTAALSKKSSRQTLVFSATLAKSLQQKLSKQARFLAKTSTADPSSMEYLLQKLSFRQATPQFVDVNPTSQMPETLREGLVECPSGNDKDLYLYTVLLHYARNRVLVFVNSISAVRRLVPFCKNLDLPCLGLHSEMPQKARMRSIERFSSDANLEPDKKTALLPHAVLIATDVAARGLDIPSVQLVIHYHLPRTADMYVHRSGRTARASASGSSILVCSPEEAAGVRRLIMQVHAKKGVPKSRKMTSASYINSIDLDRQVLSRLKPRARLSKDIADAEQAKEKQHSEDRWMAEAARDLGVDYDSDTLDAAGSAGRQGRGRKRKERERETRQWTKDEVHARKAELRVLLDQRILGKKGWNVAKVLQAKERGEACLQLPKLEF
ncbi:MAG: ATP-dependent RNA helicase [Chrysothrix sp. TS-e1954]|nr:MAG: ATP-dependent RNA helicase [Chrysothrix sp. TS-e1954]